jgi:soluble lytic murein transglycosylase-like protein
LGWLGVLLIFASVVRAEPPSAPTGETVQQAACRVVETAAHDSGLSVELLTRLIWAESRFQAGVMSAVGAQGIAQFMPATAAERGLLDPYDPEQAIPHAARLLVDLERQFGNIGLAAAAYNAGSARVSAWLAGSGNLPAQTQGYVLTLTGRTAEDWAAAGRNPNGKPSDSTPQSCIEITVALRGEDGVEQPPIAPWGVQLAGNFSRAIALASFDRARQRYLARLGDLQPMVIGTRLRSRGTRRFYRVFVPASSRAEADQLCHAIMAAGGPCVALRT